MRNSSLIKQSNSSQKAAKRIDKPYNLGNAPKSLYFSIVKISPNKRSYMKNIGYTNRLAIKIILSIAKNK